MEEVTFKQRPELWAQKVQTEKKRIFYHISKGQEITLCWKIWKLFGTSGTKTGGGDGNEDGCSRWE